MHPDANTPRDDAPVLAPFNETCRQSPKWQEFSETVRNVRETERERSIERSFRVVGIHSTPIAIATATAVARREKKGER